MRRLGQLVDSEELAFRQFAAALVGSEREEECGEQTQQLPEPLQQEGEVVSGNYFTSALDR